MRDKAGAPDQVPGQASVVEPGAGLPLPRGAQDAQQCSSPWLRLRPGMHTGTRKTPSCPGISCLVWSGGQGPAP